MEDVVDLLSVSCKVLGLGFMWKSLRVNYAVVHIPREDASFDFWSELGIDHGLKRGG
jgi:hypothetical protein